MSVGVTKDYKLKLRNLHASHRLGWKPFQTNKREANVTFSSKD
jgi:hypothetical protein